MKSLVLLTMLIAAGSLHASTSSSDYSEYRQVCMEAASDEEAFRTFKQNRIYNVTLEHVNQAQGTSYLDYIAQYSPHLLKQFSKFQENDRLGSPRVFNYPEIGNASPSTLRYVKVLGDLELYFGDLSGKKMIEIGGGYGGQCFVISKAHDFASYHLIDLPEPLKLTEKYLTRLETPRFHCIHPDNIPNGTYDLVISNYAFSECQRDVEKMYLEKVIRHAKHGYLTINVPDEAAALNLYTLNELLDALRSYGFAPLAFAEEPLTASNNVIIIW